MGTGVGGPGGRDELACGDGADGAGGDEGPHFLPPATALPSARPRPPPPHARDPLLHVAETTAPLAVLSLHGAPSRPAPDSVGLCPGLGGPASSCQVDTAHPCPALPGPLASSGTLWGLMS